MTVAFDLGYEGKPCNTSLGTTDIDNLYYVKLKFSNLLTSDYIRRSAVSICKFCNVYVRLRAASDFQQDSRCLQNNGMAACKSFSP